MKVPKPRRLPSGNYFIQLRLGGESIPVTAASETDCLHKAEMIKAAHRSGMRFEKQDAKGEKTLEQLITEYIQNREVVLSPSTISGYNTIRRTRFKGYMQKRPSAIKNWQTVINDEVRSGVSAKTIKNSWALVASALEYGGIESPSVKLPQIVQATRPWLDADQIRIFVKAVHGKDCEIPALLALHSLRRSEILGLTWEKVDLDNDVIHVEGSAVPGEKNRLVYKETNKTKNSRRNVPIMIPALKEAMAAVPEEKRTGKIYTRYQNTLWRDINIICEANGLPKVGVHGLRHSFASLAHHVGLPEQEAMLIGGWEDAQTMHRIYEHISEADRLKSQNKIAAFFQNANEKC